MNSLSGKHIVIIEDEVATMGSLAPFFNKKGCRVSKATSGKEGLSLILSCHKKKDLIDFILSDVYLPDRTGWSVMDEAKGNGIELPFLFMTGDVSKKTMAEFARRGITTYLQKAFTHDELLAAIEKTLQPHKPHPHHHHNPHGK